MGQGTQVANGTNQGQGTSQGGAGMGSAPGGTDVNQARLHQADVKTVTDIFKRNPQAVADALIEIYKDPSSAAIMDKALGRTGGIPSGNLGGTTSTSTTNYFQVGNTPSAGQQGFTYLDPTSQKLLAQAQIAAIGSVAMDPNTPADKKQIAQGFVSWNSARGPNAEIDGEVIGRAGATVSQLGIVVQGMPGFVPQPSPPPQMSTSNNGSGGTGSGSGQQQNTSNSSGSTDPAKLFKELIDSGMSKEDATEIVKERMRTESLAAGRTSQGASQTDNRVTLMDKQTEERIQLMEAQDNIKARQEKRKTERNWISAGAAFLLGRIMR